MANVGPENPFDTQQPAPVDPIGAARAASAPGIEAARAGVTDATVTPWTVTGDKTGDQTVEGRTAAITQADSPLMQLARSRAEQQANARGLVNSTMAVGAGQTAVLDQATKIAGQDAATAAEAARTNAGAANTASLANAQARNQLGLVQANMGADLAKMDAGARIELEKMAKAQGYDLARMDAQQVNDLVKMQNEFTNQQKLTLDKFGYDKQLVEIQRASNAEVARMEASYKNLTQASTSATSIINNVSANVQRIMESTSMDAAAKQAAIDIINANANRALQMIGAISGDVDLVNFFDDVLADEPAAAGA